LELQLDPVLDRGSKFIEGEITLLAVLDGLTKVIEKKNLPSKVCINSLPPDEIASCPLL
jgi:hypothetical protein